jgi:putative heme-binding domain-containing protein
MTKQLTTQLIRPMGSSHPAFLFALFSLTICLLLTPSETDAAAANGRPFATPAENIKVLPGFKAELLRSANTNEGSWICMTIDPKGRLIISPQQNDKPLLRVTLTQDGQVGKIETIPAPVRQAMGLCYAHDSLYVNGQGPNGTGLYRLIDSNRNDAFETNEVHFLKRFQGQGEHGYHAVVEGPDKMIYVMNGNHTRVPEGIETNSPHRNYQEDFLLTRLWDANGHAVGILAPGGYVVRTDLEGQRWELMLAGFRNSYDFAFNTDGEMFTFDSDMEWDWGLPWYKATRIVHSVTGGEYGWRSGTSNEPEYYADTLPPTLDVGLGSPTGVRFGTKSNYPEKYRRSFFAMDWSYGRIFAIHLTPHGATYTATKEEFLKGKPLNVTDLEFGKDGAMYFITGGRGTQSGLYRVSFTGERTLRRELSQVDKTDKTADAARKLRHKLESFHGKTDPRAIRFAWPYLQSTDRFIRSAARVAVESQPVDSWMSRALAETNTEGGLSALLALARCGGKETQADLLRALTKFPFASLNEDQRLAKLRIIGLSFIRQGRPNADLAKMAAEKLGALYPSPSERMNRELVQLLVYLEAPDVIAKTLGLIAKAPTQEEQIHYLFHLREVKSGWTLEQRRKYFAWFTQFRKQTTGAAGHPQELLQWFKEADREYADGSSFQKYLANIRKDAIATLAQSEQTALKPLIEENIGVPEWKAMKARQFVKEWTMSDLEPRLTEVGSARNFNNGRAAFNDAQCIVCHRIGTQGGSIGPELAGASSKYSIRDILEAIIEPSKVVSDQFLTHTLVKKDGESVSGRITDESAERLVIMSSPLSPDTFEEVRTADIVTRIPSKISTMPTGLVNTLTAEEILDLLAYIQSAGRAQAANFKR